MRKKIQNIVFCTFVAYFVFILGGFSITKHKCVICNFSQLKLNFITSQNHCDNCCRFNDTHQCQKDHSKCDFQNIVVKTENFIVSETKQLIVKTAIHSMLSIVQTTPNLLNTKFFEVSFLKNTSPPTISLDILLCQLLL